MRIIYAGCNLFGQVPSSNALAIDAFQVLPLDLEHSQDLLDVALGHSITVYLRKDGVFFHGHGLQPRETHQVTKLDVDTTARLKSVKACDTSVFLIDDNGDLFVLDFLARNPSFVKRILRWDAGADDQLVDFAPGSTINLGLLKSGTVLNVPEKLKFHLEEGCSVKKIIAGYEHAVILDTVGRVYTVGNGRRGQLGNGALEVLKNPQLVQSLDGIFVTDVACGGWHTLALSRDGDVYIWGWNSDGQIGLFDEHNESVSVVPVPQYLPLPDADINVAFIAAGGRHSICITSDNKVYAFGCNKFNQLGIIDYEQIVNKPTKAYQVPDGYKVKGVVCGPSSTAILTD